MNNVKYETQTAEGNARCPIQLQRETPTGLVDTTCGSEAPLNYAGLCKYDLYTHNDYYQNSHTSRLRPRFHAEAT